MKRLALRDWIGIALIFTFCSALGTLFFKAIPPTNEQIIVYMLGQLSGFVSAVVAFHYITSKGDEEKTANTGKAFDAIAAAQGKRKVEIDQPADKPVPVDLP